MNSTENVLKDFEWGYDGTVGFTRGQGYKGVGISRTMFLRPILEDIPEQLFAVKISQSPNAQKAGRPVFKYLSYRLTPEQSPSDLVPSGIDMTTPLSEIKATVISKLATFKLYDEEEPEFKTDDPNTTGNAPYYIKSDAQVHVVLKGAMSKQGNPYIQTSLSTTSTSGEIFATPQRGAIWSPDGAAAAPVAAQAEGNAEAPVW